MFRKENIDGLFEELDQQHKDDSDNEQLHRDAHLGIAYFDAGVEMPESIDVRVVDLIHRHRPKSE